MASAFDGQIYSATYSGVPVYELRLGSDSVMRRRFDGYINATHILKVAGLDKPARTRILEREVQKGIHQKVQGGYGKYQGTWIPLDTGRELARRIRILDRLLPIFDFDINGASPPPVPKSGSAAKAAKALRTFTGPAAVNGRRKTAAGAASAAAAAGSSSRRTTSAPMPAAGSMHDPYVTVAPLQSIPAGYVPASGRPRRMGGAYGAEEGEALAVAGAGMMSSTVASGSTPVRDGVDVGAGVAGELDDEDMELDPRASGHPRIGDIGHELEDDEDDEEDDEYDLDYRTAYPPTHEDDGNTAEAGLKRKRNSAIEHPRRPYRQSLQATSQQPQDPRNDPYYAVEATLGAQQQQQQQHELPAGVEGARELDERERNHILYSDQLLDYFMTVGDSTRGAIPPPIPPPTFEVDRPVDDKGNTALHWACAMGDLTIVEDLIHRGANVGARTHMDETPLVRAVLFTNNFEKHTMPKLVDLLCATLTLRDWYGATVFNHLAATTQSRGKWRSARYYAYVLLEKLRRIMPPAEIRQVLSSVDFDGDTAALKAARNGCTRLARMLLTYGPEAWDVANKNGESAREVLDRAARRKEEREREKGKEKGGYREAVYPSPTIAAQGQRTTGASINPSTGQSFMSQSQRIDPQLSAAAVEAVNNVNAHTLAQDLVPAQAHATAPLAVYDHAQQGASDALNQLPNTALHAPPYITTSTAPITSAPAADPPKQVLAQIAPILHDAYRKLNAAFGTSTPTSSSDRQPQPADNPADTSDPKLLYEHLEKDRASIRRQIDALRADEAAGEGPTLAQREAEYERVRGAYEGLVERAQARELRRRIDALQAGEGDAAAGEDADAAFASTYELLRSLAQVISARRGKVQELIDGRAEAGSVVAAAANGEASGRPANPHLRHLVALATGLKEAELDEMAGELEATLNFEKLGSVSSVDGVDGGVRSAIARAAGRLDGGRDRRKDVQGEAGHASYEGSGAQQTGVAAGADGVVISESQKTVDIDGDVDPAMEQQVQQAKHEQRPQESEAGVSAAEKVDLMN